MSLNNDFVKKSYQQQKTHFDKYKAGNIKAAHAQTWLNDDTVDSWRHQRMYKCIDVLIDYDSNSRWLTVGDGRYGKDAKYILDKGISALPTDISSALLDEASRTGYIKDYKVENAEKLSFYDDEFDYVFCKESYHHFPRPMIALYEMLRVAKKCVVLIEPNDIMTYNKDSEFIFRLLKKNKKLIKGKIKKFLKNILGNKIKIKDKSPGHHTYEESGNYVFSISRREIEKVALGLDYPAIAFKGLNDHYIKGVEYEDLSERGKLQVKVKEKIRKLDKLCELGRKDYQLLTAIIFKLEPDPNLIQKLEQDGFEVKLLPRNPYINRNFD